MFTLYEVTSDAVYLMPDEANDHRRVVKVSWELLADLADPKRPMGRPDDVEIYAPLLEEAKRRLAEAVP